MGTDDPLLRPVKDGNTFEQTYLPDGQFSARCVKGPFAPCSGAGNYVALSRDAGVLRALLNSAVYVLFVPSGMVSQR